MSKVIAVKEAVKESLLGVEEDLNMSQPNRSSFMQHAIKDEQTGEEYLNEQGFINAIAPEGEDYVSTTTTWNNVTLALAVPSTARRRGGEAAASSKQ